MGLLNAMLGNASKIETSEVQGDLVNVLAPGERLEHAYRVFRDLLVFTDKRLLLIDKQGLTGTKAEYQSIPYRSITRFSIETTGTFDADAELKLWLTGAQAPVQKQFGKNNSAFEVQSVLASYVLR